MPDCHKCPRNGQPDERCLDCARHDIATETSFQRSKHNTVSRDGLAEDGYDPAKVTITPAMLAAADEREGDADAAGCVRLLAIFPGCSPDEALTQAFELFQDYVTRLSFLTHREFIAVTRRSESLRDPAGKPTLEEIGEELGTNKQEVLEIIKNAVSKVPEVDALFNVATLTMRPAQQRRMKNGLFKSDLPGYRDAKQAFYDEKRREEAERRAEAERKARERRAEAERKARERRAEAERKAEEGLAPEQVEWLRRHRKVLEALPQRPIDKTDKHGQTPSLGI